MLKSLRRTYEKNTGKCLLNIDCCEPTNYGSDSEISDSIYKQYYLQVRGYSIYKVWMTDWFLNKEVQINKIRERLNLND